jgi:KRAB domain-containing zinc finger protein
MLNQTSDNISASTVNGYTSPLTYNSSRDGINKSRSTKEKCFLCSFCGKAFRFLELLEIHQRMHTGEKPVGCHMCQVSFSHLSHLKRYKRYHKRGKSYSWAQCEKRFSTS